MAKLTSNLPSWSKGIISVVITAGAVFAGWKLYEYYKRSKELETATEETKSTSDEAEKLKKQGVKSTLGPTALINAVNGIKQAWLDYDQILRPHTQKFYHELVKVNNDLDMLNLLKVYGIQTIDFPISKFTVNDFTGTLTQAVKNFLNDKEILAANSILAKKGIKYRF